MRVQTKHLALAAVCAALGTVIMYLGSLVEVLDLTTVFAASLLVIFLQLELGGAWPALLWLVTSALSLLLLPNRFCAFEYAFFGGLYPILKYWIEKLPRLPAYILKFVAFNVLFAFVMGVSLWFFGMETITLPVIGTLSPLVYCFILLFLGNCVFVAYDILITRLIRIYFFKFRDKIQRILK